jgi:hypothetical protein
VFWDTRWIFSANTGTMLPEHRSILGADERSRTADLISFRVIIHVLQGFARDCNSYIDKTVSLLCLALCCTVLSSRWCQCGVKMLPMIRVQYGLRVGRAW